MRIIVFGASGRVGRLVVDEALRRGYEVVAFVHTTALAERPGLVTVRGDMYDAASVKRAIAGCDAVVSCLSSWGTPRKTVLSTGMHSVLPAMQAAGIKRIVTLTGNIARCPGESFSPFIRVAHAFLMRFAPRVGGDAEEHLRLLAASGLDWTTVRSPVMVTSEVSTYRLTSKVSLFGTIPRRAVAASLVDLVASRDWLQAAPLIHRP